MKTICPSCSTLYLVDPAKVPSGGVRARCSSCQSVFRVAAPSDTSAAPRGEHRPVEVGSALPPLQGSGPAKPSPELTSPPAPSPAPAAATVPESPPPPADGTTGGAAPATLPPVFGVADPHSKARRLARALVSDIVVYHPERREASLRNGTLRQEFRDEIRKSWDEYVGQVGDSLARGTPYFREALNEILAGGQPVF